MAHHLLEESGFAWLSPRSFAGLEIETASFDLEMGSGRWTTAAASMEYALSRRWSVSARVPFAHIDYDDGGRATGLGDANLGVRAALLTSDHGSWLLNTGVELELPTGASEEGLGSGGYEASPFISAAIAPRRNLIVEAAMAEGVHLGDGNESQSYSTGAAKSSGSRAAGPQGHEGHHEAENPLHGSVLAPHHEHELLARLSATYSIRGRAYVSGGLNVS
ncbi:MAG TPA: hypothetical protein VIG29_02690, partial [Vicinamibacteria bacterium]